MPYAVDLANFIKRSTLVWLPVKLSNSPVRDPSEFLLTSCSRSTTFSCNTRVEAFTSLPNCIIWSRRRTISAIPRFICAIGEFSESTGRGGS